MIVNGLPGSRSLARSAMSLGTVLLVFLLLVLLGVLPTWSHSASWGYMPSGGLGILLIVVVALMVAGRI
jgi:hypothetical protein